MDTVKESRSRGSRIILYFVVGQAKPTNGIFLGFHFGDGGRADVDKNVISDPRVGVSLLHFSNEVSQSVHRL